MADSGCGRLHQALGRMCWGSLANKSGGDGFAASDGTADKARTPSEWTSSPCAYERILAQAGSCPSRAELRPKDGYEWGGGRHACRCTHNEAMSVLWAIGDPPRPDRRGAAASASACACAPQGKASWRPNGLLPAGAATGAGITPTAPNGWLPTHRAGRGPSELAGGADTHARAWAMYDLLPEPHPPRFL